MATDVGLFMYKQAEFLAPYRARSNVEATFSAVKAEVRWVGSIEESDRAGQRGALQGALFQSLDACSCDARAWNRTVVQGVVSDLTTEEHRNVRAAVRFLRSRCGGWVPLSRCFG
jgi:hypothetical protein